MRRFSKAMLCAVSMATLFGCQTLTETVSEMPSNLWMSDLKGADIVILGETHDNAKHHRLQAEAITYLRPDAVVFEMVPSEKTDAVAQALEQGASVRDTLEWDKSGWPEWSMYASVFDAASQSRIVGAGLPRADVRRAMTDGAKAVSGLPDIYGLGEPLPEAQAEALTQELVDAHCGMIPIDVARSMIEAQRLRDAMFAAKTLEAHRASPGSAPVVLVTGTGHARKDWGVPAYLERVAPDAKVVVVGLLEEGAEATTSLYNLIKVTPPTERDDPCAKLR